MLHPALEPLRVPGGFFDVEPCAMDLDVGRKVIRRRPERHGILGFAVHTITAIQYDHKGDVCYRVTNKFDDFGSVLHPSEAMFIDHIPQDELDRLDVSVELAIQQYIKVFEQ